MYDYIIRIFNFVRFFTKCEAVVRNTQDFTWCEELVPFIHSVKFKKYKKLRFSRAFIIYHMFGPVKLA